MARNVLRFSLDVFALHTSKAKISSLVAMSRTVSKANCLYDDVTLLEILSIPPSYRCVKDIILVVWKPPTISWIKVNTDGSVIDFHASYGRIFRDFRGTFLGCFASNLGRVSIF